MVETIYLEPGEMPPAAEKYLLVKWTPSTQMTSDVATGHLVHHVPTHLFELMIREIGSNAANMGFRRMYVSPKPKA